MNMKKISILFLSFVAFLFVGMYFAPSTFADLPSGEVAVNLTVVEGEGPAGIVVDHPPITAPYGNTLIMDPSGLEAYTEKDFAFYIHNGQLISQSDASFLVSGSTYLVVVLKEATEVVAAFVDTNGKLLDIQYNTGAFTPAYDGDTPTKPGYVFADTFSGPAGSISSDTVYVAQYTQTNDGSIEVTVTGGQASPAEPTYNQIVTLTPDSGDFSYWADADGQVVSTNPNYAFTALQPIELTAVFDEEFTTEPSVYLNNVTGIRENAQSFVGYVEYDDEGYTLVEYGLLVSEESTVLTHETDGITIVPSTALAPTNEFLRSFAAGEFTSFRAYAIFSDGENQIVKYSDNNYAVSYELEYHFNFETTTRNTTYGNTAAFTVDNLVYGPSTTDFSVAANTHNFSPINTVTNYAGGRALILSGAGSSSSRTAYIEFDFGPNLISYIEFDSFAWSATDFSDIDIARFDVWDGEGFTTLRDFKAELSDATAESTKNVTFSGFETSKVRIFVEGVSTPVSSGGNAARLVIDNFKAYVSIDTKFYGVSFINDELSQFVSIAKGTQVEEINTSREGFEFDGWFNNEEFSGSPFDLDTPINEHTVLYAKYTALPEFTITFDLQGGSGDGPYADQTKYYGQTVDKPVDPTLEGFDFEGWFTDPGEWLEEWNFDDEVQGNLDLHAYWVVESGEPSEELLYHFDFTFSPDTSGGSGSYQRLYDKNVREVISESNHQFDYSNAVLSTTGGTVNTRLAFAGQVSNVNAYSFDNTLNGTETGIQRGAGGLRFGVDNATYTKIEFTFYYDNRTTNQNAPSNIDSMVIEYWNGDGWVLAADFTAEKSNITGGQSNTLTIVFATSVETIAFRILIEEDSTANNGQLFQPTTLKVYGLE